MRAALLLLGVAACGRFGFDTSSDAKSNAADGHDPSDDSAVEDSPGDTGDSGGPVCKPEYELCDGFEADSFDSVWMPDAMVTLDTSRAHRGNRSVHVHTPAFAANANSYILLAESATIALHPTTFWIRGWFWLSQLPATNNGMELISAERPGFAGDYVFIFSDEMHLYTQFDSASEVAMSTPPTGSWFCVVFKIVRSSTQQGQLVMFGDVPNLSMPNVKTDDDANPISVVTFGMGFADGNTPSPQPALDLWIDDVIVDDNPIDCDD